MGAKKAGSGKAAAKQAKKEKQEKLASRKAAKDDKKKAGPNNQQQTNGKSGGKSGKGGKNKKAPAEEEDLDALLKKFTEDWQEAHAVNEETVGGPPTRRANATLTPCPLGTDLWLFGGEYFDGDKAYFYADLYRYTPPATLPSNAMPIGLSDEQSTMSKEVAGTWRHYSSPNQPGPRSAHQVVADPRQGGLLWLFGGEFASPKQTSFHHYRDLWVFSIASKTWDRIDTKVRPSARSGHRMVLWRQYLVLFGGFIDTGARTTYLQDLWIFDTAQYKWFDITQNDLKRPPARSGFSFVPTTEGIILHGGYCKRYVKGQRTQGVALEDTWLLKISPQADGSLLPANTPQGGKIEWEKRRKIGYAPGPRSGCTMALWGNKAMAVLFGGVLDREDDEESMESILFDDLYGYNMSGTGRWISLNLRKKKKQGGAGGKKKREKAAAAQAAQAAKQAEIEARVKEQQEEEEREAREANGDDVGSDGSDSEESDQESKDESHTLPQESRSSTPSLPTSKPAVTVKTAAPTAGAAPIDDDEDESEQSKPIARFNSMLAIQRNTLYLYGGIHETAEREYTLDDFRVLQLDKLEKWICLKDCPIQGLEWNESDDEQDDDDDSSDDGDSSSDEDEVEQEGEEVASLHSREDDEDLLEAGEEDVDPAELERRRQVKEDIKRKAREAWGVVKGGGDKSNAEAEGQTDRQSTPNPGETLRIFFDRTREHWAAKAYEVTAGQARGKESRTKGFELAEQRYEEYKPILREIERIQAEAGLDAEEMRQSAARTQNGPLGGGVGVESRSRR